MNNNENTKTIDHLRALAVVQNADLLVEAYQQEAGLTASSTGIILSAIVIAADNVTGFNTVRFILDYRGYAIEFDSSLITEDEVIANLYRSIEVLGDEMLEED